MEEAIKEEAIKEEAIKEYTISIDIGVKNFAYALGTKLKDKKEVVYPKDSPPFNPYMDIITFDVVDFRERSTPMDIMREISILFKELFEKYNIKSEKCLIYIERQVPQNTKAFGIMYGLIGLFRGFGFYNMIVYDPKKKFPNIEYDSKSKEHKKISVEWANSYLKDNSQVELYDKFTKYTKKDDISDCINMILIK